MIPEAEGKSASEVTQVLLSVLDQWPLKSWRDVNIAVALSGGADSVALLRSLQILKNSEPGSGEIFALHVNHKLRGRHSDEDAQWCQETCEFLGIKCSVLECDPSLVASEEGDGLEAAARTSRYALLTSEAERLGARYVATAHTQDDQVETILFRLLRGSGLRGVAGIPKSRILSPAVTVVRPLLDCSRQMLEKFLEDLGQAWRIDSSNEDFKFTRNRIRHKLLPSLRVEYNSNLDSILLQLASQSRDANQLVDQLASELLKKSRVYYSQGSSNQLLIEFSGSEEIFPPVLASAIRSAWRDASLPEQNMNYQWWQKLVELVLSAEEEHILNLPGNIRASIRFNYLQLEWQ